MLVPDIWRGLDKFDDFGLKGGMICQPMIRHSMTKVQGRECKNKASARRRLGERSSDHPGADRDSSPRPAQSMKDTVSGHDPLYLVLLATHFVHTTLCLHRWQSG